MKIFARVNTALFQVAEKLLIVFMGIIAAVIPYEVFGRYVLGEMPLWSGEAATYSLVWVSMLGGAVGLRKGVQASVNLLLDRLPQRLVPGFVLLGSLLLLIFLSVMVYFGLQQTAANWRQISPALGLSMAVPYSALPFGFGLMWMTSFETIIVSQLAFGRRSR